MRISWGRAVVNGRWIVVAAAAIVLAVGVGWGGGVFKNLVTGGFDDPGSQSSLATKQIAAELGPQNPDVIVIYSSATTTIDAPGFRDPLIATVRSLRTNSAVASVLTYYDTGSDALVSNGRHATYIAIRLSAVDDSGKRAAYDVIRGKLSAPGLSDRVGGNVAVQASVDAISQSDIARGEAVAMPIVLILLTLIFGGLIAGAMPLLIGILAILGAFTTTRVIAHVTEVSTFAINSITLLGLGMAIDYSLLMISRFREELEAGRSPPERGHRDRCIRRSNGVGFRSHGRPVAREPADLPAGLPAFHGPGRHGRGADRDGWRAHRPASAAVPGRRPDQCVAHPARAVAARPRAARRTARRVGAARA
jgi:RND superfamily putative drug exporter